MNNVQRGVYQPLLDNVSAYDLSDEEDGDEARSRLPLLIVIALVVAAAFFGVVWIAYNQGLAHGRASVMLVAAPAGPVRTAPENGGGAETPYTGLKIYNIPVPPDEEAQGTTLAPEPAAITADTQPSRVAPAPQPQQRAQAAPQPKAPAAKPAASPAPSEPKPQAAAHPASLLAAPGLPQLATEDAPPAKAPPPERTGTVMLQIGAYETPELANGAFAAFKARFGVVAGPLSEDVKKVDLGAKGVWYRLRVGPYATKAEATALCQTLKAKGATCFLATP